MLIFSWNLKLFFPNLNRKTIKMGLIKENNYTDSEIQFALLGKAFGHPGRIRILNLLKQEGLLRNIDLYKLLNLSIPATHKHLGILKQANLIEEHYEIHHVYFSINETGCKQLDKLYLNLH